MSLWPDVLLGIRGLRKQPASALIASFTLALGIGLCSTVFSLLYGVFFRGHPIPEPNRVFLISRSNPAQRIEWGGVTVHDFYDWQAQQTSFEGLAHFGTGTVNLANAGSGAADPERFDGGLVSANVFDLLRVKPVVGTTFRAGDDAAGAPLMVVLGYRVWERRYQKDTAIAGKPVFVNGEAATILGVMPEGFQFPETQDLWIVERDSRSTTTDRSRAQQFQVFGRLKPGVTREHAELEMAQIAQRLARDYPASNAGFTARMRTFMEDETDEDIRAVFGGMQVATLFVLLIAIANVANLLLARATLRTREAAVRTAIGASRWRVVTPFFAETLVLALVGALLGLAIAYVGVTLFDGATRNVGKPYFMVFKLDLPVLLFVTALTALTALLAGAAPAFYVLKTDVTACLKDEARGSGELGGRFTRVLVAAEIALSCALLIGAGLMVKSIGKLRNFDYPFQTERILTARVGLFDREYPDTAARRGFWRGLEERVKALPGVRAAALTTSLPGNSGRSAIGFPGQKYGSGNDYPEARSAQVTPGYFETLGVRVLQGRDFTTEDRAGSQPVAIVNQPFVRRFLDGKDPLGQRFAQRVGRDSLGAWITIVGVVPDLRMQGFSTDNPDPWGFYLPVAQRDPRFVNIVLASAGPDPLALTAGVRQAVQSLSPNQPVYEVDSMLGVIRQASWFYYVFGTLFIVFGGAALFMATVGLYGVLAFSVSRRTRELGIRMALGANAGAVTRLVLRQGGKQLLVGLVAGLGIAFGLTRVIKILMFEVAPQDPLVFALVVLLIAGVGVLASLVPARRAVAVQPTVALRSE